MELEDVEQVLRALETELKGFSAAFAGGRYSLWVGSGISRDVVPDLRELMTRVLELLRARIDPAVPDCPFRVALEEVLEVAAVTTAIRSKIDFTSPVDTWTDRETIVNSVIDKYSDVLNVYPRGEDDDYLVWTGLDVPNTYGNPALKPDAEHLCIGILMLEGVASTVQTTNWDGLIEAGLKELTPMPDHIVRVVVTPDDFREPARRSDLIKFHGCAVKARQDESIYRPLLIARRIQISGWTTRNALMKEHLQHVYTTSQALIVGLSAQDANIHTVFSQAIENLKRVWPSTPPAVMFANRELNYHFKHVLQVTYGSHYAVNEVEIKAASLLGAYAKPALAGLVLFVLADKLQVLLSRVPELDPKILTALTLDFLCLRNHVAVAAGTDERTFVRALIDSVSLASYIFRKGRLPLTGMVAYEPISTRPIDDSIQDADFPGEALGRVAIALSLFSRAHTRDGWELRAGSCTNPSGGVLTVKTVRGETKVFIVHDTRQALALGMAGYTNADPASTVLIQANIEASPRLTRSPRGRYGRTGRMEVRRVNMEHLSKTTSTVDELFEAFTLQGAF